MLSLLVFPQSMGLKSPSPFSMKAIALMQMSGLDYEIRVGDPRKGPKSKLPVLLDGTTSGDGTTSVPDSSHILNYLRDVKGMAIDDGLSTEQAAISEAFIRMIEEHLYWVLVYSRWIENPDIVREAFFGSVPALLRKKVFSMIQKQTKANLYAQGMGRHSPQEIYAFGANDVQAIADYLGDKAFFFGDTPHSIDASLFGILVNILVPPIDTPLKSCVKGHPNLVAYCTRFIERFNIPQV